MAMGRQSRRPLPQNLIDVYLTTLDACVRNPNPVTYGLKAIAIADIYEWRKDNDRRVALRSRRRRDRRRRDRRLRPREPMTDRRISSRRERSNYRYKERRVVLGKPKRQKAKSKPQTRDVS